MPANILLVEDEPAIQELIAVNLEHAGHHVIRAAFPAERVTPGGPARAAA
jgi:two-component system, OmpR family, phosphate regulon response regulator PhoB